MKKHDPRSETMYFGPVFLAGQKALEKRKELTVQEKTPGDFVSNLDTELEEYLSKYIEGVFPSAHILGEETGKKKGSKKSKDEFVLDPIDATTNLIKGSDLFDISLSFYNDNNLQWGIVYHPAAEKCMWQAKTEHACMSR